ncbi:uncharacterized protein [Nicotiana tomentosiformis]|uniref:uncharacterized protein n=1 Tax=Nicotiana tomentosiformis TaxID=4098 RepID=UPI00388C7DEB
MDHFMPAETKATHAAEFENLKQGSKSVWEYHMEFAFLSKYAIHMMSTIDTRVRRFVQGLSPLVINKTAIAALNSDMNYGKMVAFSQALENRKLKNRIEREGSSNARSAGNLDGSSGGGGRSTFKGGSSVPSQSFAQSSVSAPPSGPIPLCPILLSMLYRDCVVTICRRDTMVDFDVIMGMDWLYLCFAKLDCRTRTVRFEFPSESVIEWKRDNVASKGRFISYLKATKMINKGCIYHMVRVSDTDAEAPTLEFVLVVNEFSESREDHADHLRAVLQTLYQHQLDAKFSKSEFWLESVTYLGHVVSREGIEVDPQKISAVKNWPRPTTPIEICSFLGLAGYYRKFVEKFSTLASPLTKLTQKAVKFQCLAHLEAYQRPLAKEVHQLACLGVRLADSSEGGVIVQNRAKSSLVMEVKEKQFNDPLLRNVADIVARCPNYQQVKAEHQRPGRLVQNIEIPMWKWEMINMDIVVGLPRTPHKFDSILVIVDRLTKSAHFLPVKSTDTSEQYAQLYIKEIVRLHGTPVSIISDQGEQFTANF